MMMMNAFHVFMELQQLRYVIAIAEERSFTRAAARCHVVQSALSHQVKALENELGVMLFARTNRRVEPTTAGLAFLAAARTSVDASERAAADAAASAGLVRGSLTIGVIPTATAIDIPTALKEFRRRHPAVAIRLRGGGSDQFIAAIAEGSMDLAVLGLADAEAPRQVATRVVATERLVAVVPAAHALARRRRLRLRDLAGETFVDFPAGTPGRAQSDLAFHRAGVPRDVAFEAVSVELILDLVGHELAVTLLSPGIVPVRDDLRAIPVADGPVRVEYLAWSDLNPSPAARAFLAGMTDAAVGTSEASLAIPTGELN